jgi:hypothetical protein
MAKRTATEMSDASEGTVKAFTVVDYKDFDVSLLSVKDRGKKADGTPVFVASYNNQKLILNLTPGKNRLQVKYKVEASNFDAATCEFWRVKLVVDEQVADTIVKIEDEVKKEVIPALQTADAQKEAAWKPAVEECLFTAKLIHSAKYPAQLTQCQVRPYKKDAVAAAGWEQLTPLLNESNRFMSAQSKVVVAALLQNLFGSCREKGRSLHGQASNGRPTTLSSTCQNASAGSSPTSSRMSAGTTRRTTSERGHRP